MPTKEKIGEGLAQTIKDDAAGYVHLFEGDRARIAKAIVKYLHSQGVVIKVDGELPSQGLDGFYNDINSRLAFHKGFEKAKKVLLKAGYVAVESLI